jgi:hypothetical protein
VRAADPFFRPTIMLSGLAPEPRVAGHFEGDRSSAVLRTRRNTACAKQSAVLHKMCYRWWGPRGEFVALDQAQTGRLRTLPAVDYVDRDSLALRQVCDARTVERRSVHEDILAAPI